MKYFAFKICAAALFFFSEFGGNYLKIKKKKCFTLPRVSDPINEQHYQFQPGGCEKARFCSCHF